MVEVVVEVVVEVAEQRVDVHVEQGAGGTVTNKIRRAVSCRSAAAVLRARILESSEARERRNRGGDS